MIRGFTVLALMMLLTACGFQAVHAHNDSNVTSTELTAIHVTVDHTRAGQLLEAEVKDALNPDHRAHEKIYELNISIASSETHLFINPDGTSTRADLPLTSTYTLTRVGTGEVLDHGTITRVSSYNTTNADYSSYVSMQDAKKRVVIELAQSYKLRLANIFALRATAT